jgi:hypothetical protein
MNSASLCSLAGRYDNPIPARCLAPIDFLKIPALLNNIVQLELGLVAFLEMYVFLAAIPGLYLPETAGNIR